MCVCYLAACVEPIVEKTVIIKGADMDRAGQPRPEDDHVASGMRKEINSLFSMKSTARENPRETLIASFFFLIKSTKVLRGKRRGEL